jgi:hypothetical protein
VLRTLSAQHNYFITSSVRYLSLSREKARDCYCRHRARQELPQESSEEKQVMSVTKTVAIAGAGDVAKYLVEELLKEGRHKVVVISRAVRHPPHHTFVCMHTSASFHHHRLHHTHASPLLRAEKGVVR